MKLFDFKIRISLYSLLRPNFIFSTLSLCRSSKWCSNLTFNQIDPFSRSFLQIIPGLRQVYGGISGRACCPQFPVLTSAEMLIPHNFLFCLPPSLSPPQRYLSTHFCSIFLFSVLHIAYCTWQTYFCFSVVDQWGDRTVTDGVIFTRLPACDTNGVISSWGARDMQINRKAVSIWVENMVMTNELTLICLWCEDGRRF